MSFFHDLVLIGVHYRLNVAIEKEFLLVDAQNDTKTLFMAYNQI
jgi:hypothetical protein